FLQGQEVTTGLFWEWGALESLSFLPRVRAGRLVLSLARWRVGKDEIEHLTTAEGTQRYRRVQRWRRDRKLPRYVQMMQGDNALPLDLDNVLSVETFLHLLKKRRRRVLVEFFPEPERLCARGPEGRFVHELIVPFLRTRQRRRHEQRLASLSAEPSAAI